MIDSYLNDQIDSFNEIIARIHKGMVDFKKARKPMQKELFFEPIENYLLHLYYQLVVEARKALEEKDFEKLKEYTQILDETNKALLPIWERNKKSQNKVLEKTVDDLSIAHNAAYVFLLDTMKM